MGIGGNRSSQSQESAGTNQGFGSGINLGQENQLQNLWAQAGAVNDIGGQQQLGYNAYNQAQGLGQQAYNALGGQNMQNAFGTLNQLQNPGADPMMGVYGRQIGQQFNEQIMPGLRGDAMVGGGYGGSRAGIAQGLAGARAGQQLQDFGAQLYGQNQDRRLQAANASGALSGQISQQYAGMADQAQQLGQFGMGIPWYNLQQYAGLLGGPAMQDLGAYGSTESSGRGSSSGFQAHIW
jgi:hypothetical protein